MKVVINPSLGVPVEIAQWTINREGREEEPQRVSIEIKGKTYSMLFVNDSAPVVEVWSHDSNGELRDCRHTISLPE